MSRFLARLRGFSIPKTHHVASTGFSSQRSMPSFLARLRGFSIPKTHHVASTGFSSQRIIAPPILLLGPGTVKSNVDRKWNELIPWLLTHRLHMFLKGRCDNSKRCAINTIDTMDKLSRWKMKLIYAATRVEEKSTQYNSDTASRGLSRLLVAFFGGTIVLGCKFLSKSLIQGYKNGKFEMEMGKKVVAAKGEVLDKMKKKLEEEMSEMENKMKKKLEEEMSEMKNKMEKKLEEEMSEMEKKLEEEMSEMKNKMEKKLEEEMSEMEKRLKQLMKTKDK